MKKKLKRIVFAPKDKITEDAHKLVKALFQIEGSFITNESILEDFLSFGGRKESIQIAREKFIEQIAEKFGVVISEIFAGETRVWKVADLIRKKQSNVFYGLIDTLSLRNPTILNDFSSLKVVVSHEPDSSVSKYHLNFLLQIKKSEIIKTISRIQSEMLKSWYAFFWNSRTLYIVFNSIKFQIRLPDGWESDSYKSAQQFGKMQNIPEEYLDFKKYFLLNKNI